MTKEFTKEEGENLKFILDLVRAIVHGIIVTLDPDSLKARYARTCTSQLRNHWKTCGVSASS